MSATESENSDSDNHVMETDIDEQGVFLLFYMEYNVASLNRI